MEENIFNKRVNALKEEHLTLSSIESFTGGLFSKSVTDISGSSQVFFGSLVTYKTSIKEDVLHIKKEIIEKYGVVSKQTSIEMVKKGKEMFNTDIVVSFTGNAGPTVCEDNKQVGECYISILYLDNIYSFSYLFKDLSRDGVRNNGVNSAAKEILKIISKNSIKNNN